MSNQRPDRAFEQAVSTAIDAPNLNIITYEEAPPTPLPQETVSKTLQDAVTKKEDVLIKQVDPPTSQLAIKNYIAIPNARFPLVTRARPAVSTFVPTAFNYYHVIHYMDTLMSTNFYFERNGLLWHPFISRLYFGVLFYLQSQRAALYANFGTRAEKAETKQILEAFPPERLPVPGPLIPMLQCIATAESEYPGFGRVVPYIPPRSGPTTGHLIPATASMLGLPNLPVIAGFLNSIITAADDPPDYTVSRTFDNTAAHAINGYNFPANAWTANMRSILIQPGMTFIPETTRELDRRINDDGANLRLPTIAARTNMSSNNNYFLLEDPAWLEAVIPSMAAYCSFFKESGNLGNCSPSGPTAGMLYSKPRLMSSTDAATNIVNTLTTAFPGKYPYLPVYRHLSAESVIPQPYMLMGQYAAINTVCDHADMGNWGIINTIGGGRTGPYWNISPPRLERSKDECFGDIQRIINSYYYIEDPTI